MFHYLSNIYFLDKIIDMKIKICGMKYPENIQAVADLYPDYLGFIFYPKSKRFVLGAHQQQFSEYIFNADLRVQKVGVFVNETIQTIIRVATEYDIQIIQLHGDESPEFCEDLQLLGFQVIKAFGIDAYFDFSILDAYEDACSFFLFDTKSKEYGGTGTHFDWLLLNQYTLSKPIFLSGGLEIKDISIIQDLAKVIPIHALDFNSKLEIEPALKDIEKCSALISLCRNVTMK